MQAKTQLLAKKGSGSIDSLKDRSNSHVGHNIPSEAGKLAKNASQAVFEAVDKARDVKDALIQHKDDIVGSLSQLLLQDTLLQHIHYFSGKLERI